MNNRKNIGFIILLILGFISLIGMFVLDPIEQDNAYHDFCDSATILSVSNFWNVISNLPFMIVGFLGLYKMNSMPKPNMQYVIFFLGVLFTSLGSSYYHLNPNNEALVWDRLPMTIVFMSLFSIIISEFINAKIGRLLLFPLLIIGALSIVFWISNNDLRMYALVQFYPMLAIPVILIFFKSNYNKTLGYWLLLLAYVIAKIMEHLDEQIYIALGFISGHSLKHIVASIGLFVLFYSYTKRKRNTILKV